MKHSAVEEEARIKGYRLIAGVDEAGRGPLAGPVVAAACLLPKDHKIIGINDSKQLSFEERARLVLQFAAHQGVVFAIGVVDHERIDQINILQASLEAMRIAVEQLAIRPDFLLVDGLHLPKVTIPARPLIKGDTLSESIGAASILAKHHRDQLMISYHEKWPEYGFDRHKGYPTLAHLNALRAHGPCPIHRRSFAPVKEALL